MVTHEHYISSCLVQRQKTQRQFDSVWLQFTDDLNNLKRKVYFGSESQVLPSLVVQREQQSRAAQVMVAGLRREQDDFFHYWTFYFARFLFYLAPTRGDGVTRSVNRCSFLLILLQLPRSVLYQCSKCFSRLSH